jgi:glycosyltransferase involved in cell wall biosynthesis
MKITIAASHRFHLLDLARELASLGHEVRFYSYVPTKRAVKFGLKKENSFSLYWMMLPFLALYKISRGANWSVKLKNQALDFLVSKLMKPCDVYIALGTIYKNSLLVAKHKHKAITILEWGSKHINEEEIAIATAPYAKKQDAYFIQRSIDGYELADYIAIPAEHVEQSFLKQGIHKNKLLVNPYGVDLSMFKPTTINQDNHYDVIMVGTWSFRKGCDFIINALSGTDISFLHVGSIGDLAFPKYENFTHVDAVDQSQLIEYYAKAKVFLLPSRTEGLAMVQAQAIACGLTVICSENTGGRDLRNLISDKKRIIELEDMVRETIIKTIQQALQSVISDNEQRNYIGQDIQKLSWRAYGNRYDVNLIKIKEIF